MMMFVCPLLIAHNPSPRVTLAPVLITLSTPISLLIVYLGDQIELQSEWRGAARCRWYGLARARDLACSFSERLWFWRAQMETAVPAPHYTGYQKCFWRRNCHFFSCRVKINRLQKDSQTSDSPRESETMWWHVIYMCLSDGEHGFHDSTRGLKAAI